MKTVNKTLIFLALGVCALLAAWYIINPKLNYKVPETMLATAFKPTKALNAFQLTDTNDNLFNEKSLRGHWTLLFFGYPRCPDICPATLGILRDVWQTYTPSKAPARFVFASIDPTQVENSVLRTFVQNYNPEFIGLSGSPKEMAKLSNQLGIFYKEQAGIIDHTAALMLIDPQARLSAIFTPPFTAQQIAHDLKILTHS